MVVFYKTATRHVKSNVMLCCFLKEERPEKQEDVELDDEEIKSGKKRTKTDRKQSKKKRHDIEMKNKLTNDEPVERERTEANDVADIVEDLQFSDLDD